MSAEEQGKRYPLNMRATKATREKLEASAKASGRSLSAEVEYRIQSSLEEKDRFAALIDDMLGRDNVGVLVRLGKALTEISETEGRSWMDAEADLTPYKMDLSELLQAHRDRHYATKPARETMIRVLLGLPPE